MTTATAEANAIDVRSLPPLGRGLFVLWDKTLNSVIFGITLMVLLALYIAIGSGFASLRAWFEMNDLQFFNAWPMRILAGLLVANLLTVSLSRIPFTLPRLGVWCIHLGVIILVFGLVRYFSGKTEGMTLVRIGETVDTYYDSSERALYVNAGRRKSNPLPLTDLPRFEAYAPEFGNDAYLRRQDLSGLVPEMLDYDEQTRTGQMKPIHEAMDLPGAEPIQIDVLAYYPYAVIGSAYDENSGDLTGLRLTLRDPETGERSTQWAVAEQPGHEAGDAAEEQVATVRLRHLHRSDELTGDGLLTAARGAHEIEWHVNEGQGLAHGGAEGSNKVTIEPGKTVALGDTGYSLEAVAFLPGFPLFGDGEPVDVLELLVHPPADSPHGKTFRRYVLNGREGETDFVLDVEGAGPKGERQSAPVDTNLHLHYALADGLQLLPRSSEDERQTILTKANEPGYWQLVTRKDAPARLEHRPDGKLELAVNGQLVDPVTNQPSPYSLELDVERVDGIGRRTWVAEVPEDQRDNQAAQSGSFQVVTVRVRRGDWSETLPVPFTQWPDQQQWQPASVRVPGLDEPLRLQLANTRRPMPARVTLDRFELVPYAGDFTAESAMRDFRSHLTIDPLAGEPHEATVKLNNPHYLRAPSPLGILPGESWLLFQNQWDPEEQAFTVLGVGNRPGVVTMTVGCVMIVLGLMWAFYVKPVIIRHRQAKALAAAGR